MFSFYRYPNGGFRITVTIGGLVFAIDVLVDIPFSSTTLDSTDHTSDYFPKPSLQRTERGIRRLPSRVNVFNDCNTSH